MFSRLFSLAFALIALVPSAHAQLSDAELQQLYTTYLDGRGLANWVDGDGDVQFELDNRTYYIGTNEGDDQFFNLVAYQIWPIESDTERFNTLNAMQAISAGQKVIKGYFSGDNVSLACEIFLPTADAFPQVFDRCTSALDSSVDVFVDNMDG
jgi:hypothetical protein